jgi:transcription initiation factor IIF auxiliary subunit
MLNLPDQVIIGNTHEKINTDSDNSHKWVMYVKAADGVNLESYIETVEFHLHPTFTPPSYTVTKPPYSISRLGWGTFTVKVIINWKPQFHQPQLLHSHDLCFSAPDTFNIVKII